MLRTRLDIHHSICLQLLKRLNDAACALVLVPADERNSAVCAGLRVRAWQRGPVGRLWQRLRRAQCAAGFCASLPCDRRPGLYLRREQCIHRELHVATNLSEHVGDHLLVQRREHRRQLRDRLWHPLVRMQSGIAEDHRSGSAARRDMVPSVEEHVHKPTLIVRRSMRKCRGACRAPWSSPRPLSLPSPRSPADANHHK